MSSGTNQQRIEENNLKLAQLKTKADNLPEYQDIEPVYSSTSLSIKNTIQCSSGVAYGNINVYKNWVLTLYKSGSYYRNVDIFYNGEKIINNFELTKIAASASMNLHILYADDDIIYFLGYGNDTMRWLYKCDRKSKEVSYIKQITFSYSYPYSEATPQTAGRTVWQYNGGESGVIFGGLNGFTRAQGYATSYYDAYRFDLENENLIFAGNLGNSMWYSGNSANIMFNPCYTTISKVLINSSGELSFVNTHYNRNDDAIHGCNFNGDKYFAKGNVYRMSADLTKGECLKENVYTVVDPTGSSSNSALIRCLSSNLYAYSNKIMRFNEETNTFEDLLTGTFYITNGYIWTFNNSTKMLNVYSFDKGVDIGLNYNSSYYKKNPSSVLNSSNVLEGVDVYNSLGSVITGTMPNNGELNYTPSTSQQTIPAGYTSGGTVAAVSMTEQEIEQAETLAETILS